MPRLVCNTICCSICLQGFPQKSWCFWNGIVTQWHGADWQPSVFSWQESIAEINRCCWWALHYIYVSHRDAQLLTVKILSRYYHDTPFKANSRLNEKLRHCVQCFALFTVGEIIHWCPWCTGIQYETLLEDKKNGKMQSFYFKMLIASSELLSWI